MRVVLPLYIGQIKLWLGRATNKWAASHPLKGEHLSQSPLLFLPLGTASPLNLFSPEPITEITSLKMVLLEVEVEQTYLDG